MRDELEKMGEFSRGRSVKKIHLGKLGELGEKIIIKFLCKIGLFVGDRKYTNDIASGWNRFDSFFFS